MLAAVSLDVYYCEYFVRRIATSTFDAMLEELSFVEGQMLSRSAVYLAVARRMELVKEQERNSVIEKRLRKG